jgi:hypothetical protein
MSALCQKQTKCIAAKSSLFDPLIGRDEQVLRHDDAGRHGRQQKSGKVTKAK